MIWNHPIDVHYFTKALQGWPRIVLQVHSMDSAGIRELGTVQPIRLCLGYTLTKPVRVIRAMSVGYSFAFVPATPGYHEVECALWRPVGTPTEEVQGGYPDCLEVAACGSD